MRNVGIGSFSLRVISRSTVPCAATDHVWHGLHAMASVPVLSACSTRSHAVPCLPGWPWQRLQQCSPPPTLSAECA